MVSATTAFYEFLDTAFKDPHMVECGLKKFLTEDVIGEERKKLLIEIKCFEFYFQGGTIKPNREYIGQDGKYISYPDINGFNNEEIEYIKSRLDSVSNPYLAARYSHLLWLINKHNSFAEIAVESYLKLSDIFFEISIKGNIQFYKFCQALHCFHNISLAAKYKIDECRVVLLKWINNSQLPVTWKDNIADIIADSPLYKRMDIQGVTAILLSFIPTHNDQHLDKERYLKTCLSIAQKEGVSLKEIYDLLGENELFNANENAEDESGMIAMSCYQKATYYFRLAENNEKFNQASTLYTNQKNKFKLKLFQYEFDPEKVKVLNDSQNTMVEKMLSSQEVHPCLYLVHNRNIIMSEDDLVKQAQEAITASSFLNLISTQVYDLNNNAKALITDEDKLEHQKFQTYIFNLQLYTITLLHKFFYRGFRTGKLTKEEIMAFLNKSWMGRKLAAFSADETPDVFSWMELVGPALFDLLSQLETQILDKEFKPNFVLSIDSLSIKIEGLIRDIARLSGQSVTKIKENESQEMNLEELLKDESISKIFTGEDVLLWKYLLTKKGWNMRNNIAHSFYRPADYNESKAILLLLAVFRLCKYDTWIQAE